MEQTAGCKDGDRIDPARSATRRPGPRSRRTLRPVGAFLLLAGGALALASCSNAAASVQGRSASPLLAASPAKHVVDLQLLAADPNGASQFNFDGASSGHMTITVPLGWKVDVTCSNRSTTLDHSCAIVSPSTGIVAFAGSSTPDPVQGVPPGKAEAFSFVASRAGTYELVCLVPGHREAGMWDHFVVRSGARPSIVGAHP